MSTQRSPGTHDNDSEQDDITTACGTSLTGDTTTWLARPATAYPPGYPALCTACFNSHVPSDAWNEDGTAEFDHTTVTETLVCSSQQGTKRRYHLPKKKGDS
jgi:hypothetical protein